MTSKVEQHIGLAEKYMPEDPAIMLALIEVESGGDPAARDPAQCPSCRSRRLLAKNPTARLCRPRGVPLRVGRPPPRGAGQTDG